MKKASYFVLLLIAISSLSFAQQDTTTIFRSPRGYFNDPIRSNWDRKVERKDNLWILSLYDRKKVLQERISFEDHNLEIRKGPYVLFKNAKVIEEGEYDKGYKYGEWKSYNENGKLVEKINYSWDKLNGLSEIYWDNGQLARTGKYVVGKKNGLWNTYYRDGRLAGKEWYNEGGMLKEKKYYDPNGAIVEDNQLFQSPSYPAGMEAFYSSLGSLIRYPVKAAHKGVEGSVKLAFTIKKDGSVDDIKVVESPSDLLSLEAVRVLRISGKWIPGKQLGEYVEERYSLPIKFSLNK